MQSLCTSNRATTGNSLTTLLCKEYGKSVQCVGSTPLPSCSSQSACWRSWAACCSSRPHFSTRMLRCSCSMTHCCHRADLDSAASTTSARRPRRTTGSIWWKSLASSNTLPPNSLSVSIILRSVRSSASNRCLWDIGASFHTISFVWRISSAVVLRGVILHVESASTGIGSLNRECAVRPSLSSVAAIPEPATANATSFRWRTYASARTSCQCRLLNDWARITLF